MNKKQKILAIIGLSLTLILAGGTLCFAASTSTSAQNAGTLIGGFTAGAINFVFQGISNIIGFIGGILFQVAGGLTNFALSLNFDILNNPMISVGWGITRDLANLGFVLFIIIIAIATILRAQQYGAKSTLGKLIAVALLVNFSLLFAGVFIDFSNMLTNYFIKSITPGGDIGGLGPSLANAFGIQNLLNVKDATGMSSLLALKGQYMVIASSFFVAAFTFLGALSLLALATMFLVRYIVLSILLILVPMAFLFVVFPATGKLFSQWLSQFMKWIIFAPAASFFLYLAVYMTINYGKMMNDLATSSQGIGTANQMNFANLTINQPLQTIGRMVIVIGLLLGGLITANSMGIHGSKAFMGMAQGAGKWTRGKIGGLAAGGAQKTFMGGVQRDAKTGEITTRGQRIATAISGIPGFKGAAQRISAFSSPQAKAEDVEKYRKDNLTPLANAALIRQMTTPGALTNRTAAAAMIQEAARRGLTNDKQLAPLLERYIKTAQGMGNINTVLNNRPDLAPIAVDAKTTQEKTEAIKKVMNRIRADKADEISHEAFKNEDVVLGLSNSHLERLARVGEPRQKDEINKIIKANFGPQLALIKKTRADIAGVKQKIADAASRKLNKEDMDKLITQRDALIKKEETSVSGLNAKDRKISEHDTFISQNPNWQT